MIYSILASWISFIFPVFYKRLQIHNAHWLKIKSPAIIAINHPNAFADPVGLGFIMYPTRFWYLARGDVFTPGFMSWILDKIGIIPIYRMMDSGKEGLKKNDATYKKVNDHLKNNLKVIVFAEGLCIMERRLRPLKKGVARMAFGAMDHLNGQDLLVIPVGVNYDEANKFRSNLFYNVGEPISMKEFLKDKEANSAKTQKEFLELLEPKLRSLISHIDDEANDTLVIQCEQLYKKQILLSRNLNPENLEHDLRVVQEITAIINKAAIQEPVLLNQFRLACDSYFQKLKKFGLKDWLLRPENSKQISILFFGLRLFILLLFSPIFVIGYCCNILPHKLSFFMTRKIAKSKEFFASVITIVAASIFLIYYLIFFLVIWFFLLPFWPSISCVAIAMFCAHFNLSYLPFAYKTLGIYRLLKNKLLFTELGDQRKQLTILFNKIKQTIV